MAHKNMLHDLLKQDQEPFNLKTYLADKYCQLQKPTSKTTLQLKKQRNLLKNVCFSSLQDSADVKKPAFLQFLSPACSPCKYLPNAARFLGIPTRTTTILVEGQQSSSPKSQVKDDQLGSFRSIVKIFQNGNNNKMRINNGNNRINVLSRNGPKNETNCEETVRKSISWYNINGKLSSVNWSESNDEKSMEWEASTCSYMSEETDETDGDFTSTEKGFCLSSFRFSMHKSPPSSGHQTPEFCTPVASPSRHPKKENENYDTKISKKEGEEEKEQCSPLSVLEPSFEDYEDSRGSELDAEEKYDLECSFANVQRARQKLLYQLQRFEKLSELDPNELERRLLEESDSNNGDDYQQETEDWEDDAPLLLYRENNGLTNPTCKQSTDTKRLAVEGNNAMLLDTCSRLDSWKGIKLDSIYRMTESDFSGDVDGWKEYTEEVKEISAEMEIEIFELSIEQLLDEVLNCT